MGHSGERRNRRERPRAWCRWEPLWGLAVCVAILTFGGEGWPAEPWGARPGPMLCGGVSEPGAPATEVTFAGPHEFVIVTETQPTGRRLYEAGDSISRAHEAGADVRILRIEGGRMQVRHRRLGTAVWLEPGDPVPGVPGRFFAGTALLGGLDYHYRVAERPIVVEPKLRCIHGDRAVLEVTVPSAPQGLQAPVEGNGPHAQTEAESPVAHAPEQGHGEVRRVVEVAPNTYEVGAKDMQDLLDHGERLVAEAWTAGWLSVPRQDRVRQDVESPVADGTLGPRGFRLTSPKLAEAAGLETGDVILAVDGQTVNNFADLYRVYQQIRRAARRPRFEVTLERDGAQLTKTYLIQ